MFLVTLVEAAFLRAAIMKKLEDEILGRKPEGGRRGHLPHRAPDLRR